MLHLKNGLTLRKTYVYFFLLLLCTFASACARKADDYKLKEVKRLDQYTTTKEYVLFAAESFENWQKKVPEIQHLTIKSTLDGKQEPALFYASDSHRKKPLLVVLHSWSSTYLQEASIPFAIWAKEYDWAFIQPNYRGVFESPEATASDLAIQDIMDAVAYSKGNTEIDESRVYIVGSSGGAMTALVAAGRHPEVWAGVVAWVPIFDLVDWYQFNLTYPDRKYNGQIAASCGGIPTPGTEAAAECKRRSPSTYIENAREVPIFLAHGMQDLLVPPDHSIRAFNILAEPADTISQEQIDYILKEQSLPESIDSTGYNPYFGQRDPKVYFTRKSKNVQLVMFEGVHNMAYNPGLLWLNEQQRK
jgi:dipeptidyl aminopeptidase/acylaminoacyl peptidase